MDCCPSETTPRIGTGSAAFTSRSSAARSASVPLSRLRASSGSPVRQSRITQSTSWPTSGCIPSSARPTPPPPPGGPPPPPPPRREPIPQPVLVGQPQRHQLLVALDQVRDRPLGQHHAALAQ